MKEGDQSEGERSEWRREIRMKERDQNEGERSE